MSVDAQFLQNIGDFISNEFFKLTKTTSAYTISDLDGNIKEELSEHEVRDSCTDLECTQKEFLLRYLYGYQLPKEGSSYNESDNNYSKENPCCNHDMNGSTDVILWESDLMLTFTHWFIEYTNRSGDNKIIELYSGEQDLDGNYPWIIKEYDREMYFKTYKPKIVYCHKMKLKKNDELDIDTFNKWFGNTYGTYYKLGTIDCQRFASDFIRLLFYSNSDHCIVIRRQPRACFPHVVEKIIGGEIGIIDLQKNIIVSRPFIKL